MIDNRKNPAEKKPAEKKPSGKQPPHTPAGESKSEKQPISGMEKKPAGRQPAPASTAKTTASTNRPTEPAPSGASRRR